MISVAPPRGETACLLFLLAIAPTRERLLYEVDPMNPRRQTKLAFVAALLVTCLALSQGMTADEGMWTFDNFPSKVLAANYGFSPTQAWLDHVRASSLRIAQGCSASFISPQGLVMTNHHCVLECVQQLSTAKQNFVETGFSAATAPEER